MKAFVRIAGIKKEKKTTFEFPQINFKDPIRCDTNLENPIKISLPEIDKVRYWLASGSKQFVTLINGVVYIHPSDEEDAGRWDIKLHAQYDNKKIHVYGFKVIVDHFDLDESGESLGKT